MLKLVCAILFFLPEFVYAQMLVYTVAGSYSISLGDGGQLLLLG